MDTHNQINLVWFQRLKQVTILTLSSGSIANMTILVGVYNYATDTMKKISPSLLLLIFIVRKSSLWMCKHKQKFYWST